MQRESSETTCVHRGVDTILLAFLFLPLITLWWASSWQLQDIYIYSDFNLKSGYISLGVGSIICFIGHMVQPLLAYTSATDSYKHKIVLRIFVYVYAVGYICYFRGMWIICDEVMLFVPVRYKEIVLIITLGCCVLLLVLSRTTASPFAMSLDTDPRFCHPSLLFSTQFQSNTVGPYMSDVIVTFFGITSLTVLIWYTIMGVMDDRIYPENKLKSYIVCVVAGYVLCLLFMTFPSVINWFTKQLSKVHLALAYVFVEFVKFTALLCNVSLWRGAWQLVDDYTLDNVVWRNWLCHFGSFAVLVALQVCTVLAPVGCAKDYTTCTNLNLDWTIGYIGFKSTTPQDVVTINQSVDESDNDESKPLIPNV